MQVGNKADLAGRREVEAEEAEDFAQTIGVQYIETSVLGKSNIQVCKTKLVLTKPNLFYPNQTRSIQTKLILFKLNSFYPNQTHSIQTKLILSKPNSFYSNQTHSIQTKLILSKPNSFYPNKYRFI